MKSDQTLPNDKSTVVDDTPTIHAAGAPEPAHKVKIGRSASWRGSSALIVMALFVLIGGYILVRSFASTATVTKTWGTQADWSTGTLSNTGISNNAVTLTQITTTSSSTTTAGSTDLALRKPITASSTFTSGKGKNKTVYSAGYANDGNPSTHWQSQSNDPQYITVDLGAVYNISEVILNWNGTNYSQNYILEVSPDNSTWSTIYRSNGLGDGGSDDLSGLSGTGRYIRVYGTTHNGSGYGLSDFNVYGSTTQTTYAPSGNILLTYDGDTGSSSTSSVAWSSIAPTSSLPTGTSISYQARTSNDKTNWSSWVTVSGSLSGLLNSRYLQLQANLSTTDTAATPTLLKLVLSYVVTTADPAPTVSLTASPASVASGTASTLSWSSTNATSCTASGAWSGAQATSGSVSTGNLTANATYNLSCSGAGGISSATTTVAVTAAPVAASPSGVPMPVGDVTSGGHTWHQILKEDFTKNLALGSWNDSGTLTSCPSNADAVQYVGDQGTSWTSYPKCYLNTDHVHHYRSDQTLSVHDGTLDYYLHAVNGVPTSANPGPVMPDGTRYQTYGRYEVRFKTTSTALNEFYVAWLLWPKDDTKWTCAESDFPETNLGNTSVNAFAHYNTDTVNCPDTNRSQDYYNKSTDLTGWHTYTQEWLPGKRNYYLDGQLLYSSTNYVYAGPERWQLQTEVTSNCDSTTTNTCTQDGHLLVDWATVYAY